MILQEEKSIFLKSLGKIAAGGPIEAITDQQRIELEYLFTNKRSYALKVTGDSMIDAGICDGDWVIVEEGTKPYKSKVHVILIDNQDVTLRVMIADTPNTTSQVNYKLYYLATAGTVYLNLYGNTHTVTLTEILA